MGKNLIISGSTNTGKTTNIIFPMVTKMINNKESFIVLDANLEYLNNYYNELKKEDYNTIILNLKDLTKSEGWNPLEYSYNLYKKGNEREAIKYLHDQAEIMFYEGEKVDPFWQEMATNYYQGVVLGLFEDAKEDEVNLNSINLMTTTGEEKLDDTTLIKKYFALKDQNSASVKYASFVTNAPAVTKGGILSVFKQKLRLYVSLDSLSSLLNKTTFSYNDILTKKTAIFIITNKETSTKNNIASMLIKELFRVLTSSNITSKFNFILDNIDILDKIFGLDTMLESSKNIRFIIATRYYDDLIKKYGSAILKFSQKIESETTKELTIQNNNIQIDYPNMELKNIEMFKIEDFIHSKK